MKTLTPAFTTQGRKQPSEIEQHARFFETALGPGREYMCDALWELWALRLEHQPESRKMLKAIGDLFKTSSRKPDLTGELFDLFETENKAYASKMQKLFLRGTEAQRLPFEYAAGETRMWHHLLLFGGTHRLSAAQAFLKAGFDPWKDASTTPLPLLLATGDIALCTFLFEQKKSQDLRTDVTRTFACPHPTSEQTVQKSLVRLAQWCLQHDEPCLATGRLLALHMLAPFHVKLSYEEGVSITKDAATSAVAERWWRQMHHPEVPPRFPQEILTALRTRLFPAPLDHREVTRLSTLFQGSPRFPPSASDTAIEEIQKKRLKL